MANCLRSKRMTLFAENIAKKIMPAILALAALVCTDWAGSGSGAAAAEFRSRNPILTPAEVPAGAQPVAQAVPVERSVVEAAVKQLFGAYGSNIGEIEPLLGEDMYDRSRLLDNFVDRLPRDTTLTVLGIQAVQTLSQHIEADPVGGGNLRVSLVSVTVAAQIVFNDPVAGYQRRSGTAEYILRIKENAP